MRAKVVLTHQRGEERLWAEQVGRPEDDLWLLLNIPWFTWGVSYQDVVHVVRDADGTLRFDRVDTPSGRSTVHVIVRETADPERVRAHFANLKALGCRYEQARTRWFAFDVPAEASWWAVVEALDDGANDGVWVYDEANLQHDVGP